MNYIYFLFPVHNEEKRILKTILFIKWVSKNFKKNKCKFVFLLNNCTDKTEHLLKKKFQKYPIKILKSKYKKRGFGLNKFFRLKKRGYYAICSVDNAWSFNFYKKAFFLLKKNKYQIIYGPKSHPNSKIKTNFIRKFISNCSKFYIKFLFKGLVDQDTQCIKFFRSDLKFLTKLQNYNYFAETEFYIISKLLKNKFKNIPVNVKNDNLNSKVNIRSIINYIIESINFRFKFYKKFKNIKF